MSGPVSPVPAKPPAKQFWSLTIYDTRTRCLIDNPQGVADKSSRMPDLVKNTDDSVDLYMGPKAPAGHEQNWIPTVPGKYWFAYFRLYAPLEPYLNASWQLPAGPSTRKKFFEFFTVPIRNAHTRAAYYRAIQQFLAWSERAGCQHLEGH